MSVSSTFQRRAPWLWLLVVLQVGIAASYYVRDDRNDERFAWRMFSAVRVERCQVRVLELDEQGASRAVPLKQALHTAWIGGLKRGRQRVIRAFSEQRCRQPSVARVRLVRRCTTVDGALRQDEAHLHCDSGRYQWEPSP